MKNGLLLILSLLFLSTIAQDSYKQYISYDVPIHMGLKTNGRNQISSYSDELSIPEMESLSLSRLNTDLRKKMTATIFNKLLSGEVTAYLWDAIYTEDEYAFEDPKNYFKTPLTKEEVVTHLSYVESTPIYDDYGEPEYDDDGNPIYYDDTIAYSPGDIVAITFYEEWIIDPKTNQIQKTIKGYVPNVAFIDEGGSYQGLRSLVYIACSEKISKKAIVISKNIESYTEVSSGSNEFTDVYFDQWWCNGLLPNVRNPLIGKNDFAPFMSLNKPAKLYQCIWSADNYEVDVLADFPFKNELTAEQLIDNTRVTEVFDKLDEDGEPMYDDEGFPILEDYHYNFEVKDIKQVGFIEEWKFDEKTLSISKTIKGVMPTVYQRNENGHIVGLHPMFCLKYE